MFWSMINEFCGVSKSKHNFPIQHFLNGNDTAGSAVKEVADSFNDFVSQVGNKLASGLPPVTGPPVVHDNVYRTQHVLQLEHVTQDQVRR